MTPQRLALVLAAGVVAGVVLMVVGLTLAFGPVALVFSGLLIAATCTAALVYDPERSTR